MAGGVGNLVARVLGISAKISNFEFRISDKFENKELKKQIKSTKKRVAKKLEEFKFNEALASVWGLISFCDKYINEEKLWETKNPKVINDLFFTIKEIAGFLRPFLPETSEKIMRLYSGQAKPEILFPRLQEK
ncbi:MAG: hypothetical protein A2528_00490 [Candidatus Staskawiczbacteria bacterium RIFOXYD2_FULL_37_9]|nr:MAG: hypothetical protein A2528_00490 [Candidatus Staskawiczbacteria bacterium RIFOXYD2_FULL_37_9]